jgi:hypothetical protein
MLGQASAVARLSPAMASMMAAAARVIQVSGMTLSRSPAKLGVLVGPVLGPAAQQERRADREQRGDDDLDWPVREQREQAAGGDGQPHVHRERGRDPGEHVSRAVAAAKDDHPSLGYSRRPIRSAGVAVHIGVLV